MATSPLAKRGLTIGYVSDRTGLPQSAIRYYEDEGLVTPDRNESGHRRYARHDIRRLSFVMIAQQFGFTLPQIKAELDRLPSQRTPTKDDWAAISTEFRAVLDRRIATLTKMRDRLDSCIGCGCLSLDTCALYNPGDQAASQGQGPRFLMDDAS